MAATSLKTNLKNNNNWGWTNHYPEGGWERITYSIWYVVTEVSAPVQHIHSKSVKFGWQKCVYTKTGCPASSQQELAPTDTTAFTSFIHTQSTLKDDRLHSDRLYFSFRRLKECMEGEMEKESRLKQLPLVSTGHGIYCGVREWPLAWVMARLQKHLVFVHVWFAWGHRMPSLMQQTAMQRAVVD